jgi:hypothetical protein
VVAGEVDRLGPRGLALDDREQDREAGRARRPLGTGDGGGCPRQRRVDDEGDQLRPARLQRPADPARAEVEIGDRPADRGVAATELLEQKAAGAELNKDQRDKIKTIPTLEAEILELTISTAELEKVAAAAVAQRQAERVAEEAARPKTPPPTEEQVVNAKYESKEEEEEAVIAFLDDK